MVGGGCTGAVGATAAATVGVVGAAVGGDVVGATVMVVSGRLVVVGIVVDDAGARVVVGADVLRWSVMSPPRAAMATAAAMTSTTASAVAATKRRRFTVTRCRPAFAKFGRARAGAAGGPRARSGGRSPR